MSRKSRNEIDKSELDLLKPLDLTLIGTENDPCFGKLFDLKAEECKICGDSEICSIVFSQKLNIDRLILEKGNNLKGSPIKKEKVTHDRMLYLIIKKYLKRGKSDKYILRKCFKRYNLEKSVISVILTKLKKKYGHKRHK